MCAEYPHWLIANGVFFLMDKILDLHLPIKTVSEANCSEHWSTKHKRHKKQKKAIWHAFKREGTKINPPCRIKLTRISPRKLDIDENLPMVFKWIKDQIADYIHPEKTIGQSRKVPGRKIRIYGRSDDDERITWEFDQEKGSPQAIRVEVFI
jgi:hypothetical protein